MLPLNACSCFHAVFWLWYSPLLLQWSIPGSLRSGGSHKHFFLTSSNSSRAASSSPALADLSSSAKVLSQECPLTWSISFQWNLLEECVNRALTKEGRSAVAQLQKAALEWLGWVSKKGVTDPPSIKEQLTLAGQRGLRGSLYLTLVFNPCSASSNHKDLKQIVT